MKEPIQVEFGRVIDAYKNVNRDRYTHNTHLKDVIKKHSCFNDIKIKEFHQPPIRHHITKIGTTEDNKNIFRKELIGILNKVTMSNIDTITDKILKIVKPENSELFIHILWDYFKQQPVYQPIYIKLLHSVYDSVSFDTITLMNGIWTSIWNKYIKDNEWHISLKLIEDSHNYDDFCEYIKEKKRLNAMAEGWFRIIQLGIVNTPLFEWVYQVIQASKDLDLTNILHRSVLDSYIEQIRDYCKGNYAVVPNDVIYKLEPFLESTIQKSTKFKIQDLIEEIKKMKGLCLKK